MQAVTARRVVNYSTAIAALEYRRLLECQLTCADRQRDAQASDSLNAELSRFDDWLMNGESGP